MSITVIVCTYNRCNSLVKALSGLAASIVPTPVEWEVVVVDNNSTDGTREVVGSFCQRFPGRFRYVLEQRQGLSHARNAGIREAHGDVLAFTDDDVDVDRSWLWNLTAPLANGEWAGTTGRIIPMWTSEPPRWLPLEAGAELGSIVAFDLGPTPRVLMEAPVGANMAFRRKMFEMYGNFRTDLGRSAAELLSGEDSEFGHRLLAGGERLRYEPSAVVHHPVSEERLTKKYHLAWRFGSARSVVRMVGVPPKGECSLHAIAFNLFPRLVRRSLLWMVSIDPAKRFYSRLSVWGLAGSIAECYAQWRHANGRGQFAKAGDSKDSPSGLNLSASKAASGTVTSE